MQFPFLSVIVFTPLVAALILLLYKPEQKKAIRITALSAALFALTLSIAVYFSYDKAVAGYQFIEKYNWMPMLGISLHFGVDGMSAPLVLLTGIVMVTGVMISWGIEVHVVLFL
jgi:NADH-quinone oxidoreductase subunit M